MTPLKSIPPRTRKCRRSLPLYKVFGNDATENQYKGNLHQNCLKSIRIITAFLTSVRRKETRKKR
jgi:hypothetical protein